MPAETTRPGRTPLGTPLETVAIVAAVALQLVVLVPFTVASGLMAPLWGIIALYLLWGIGVAVLVVVARRRPLWSPLVPLVNAAAWFGVMTLGENVLGWTA